MGTCIHDDKFYIITEYVKNGNLKTVNIVFINYNLIITINKILINE